MINHAIGALLSGMKRATIKDPANLRTALDRIRRLIEASPVALDTERAAQDGLAALFTEHKIVFRKEVTLEPGSRIDFIVEIDLFVIGVEAKVNKGSPRAIFHQIERYARHESLDAVLLVSNKAMVLPASIGGKPVAVASLARGWL